MSRSKNPLHYPLWCVQTMRNLERTPSKPQVFTCPNEASAGNCRMTWSCFKRAALDTGYHIEQKCPSLPDMVARIIRNADGLHVEIQHDGRLHSDTARWNKEAGVGFEPQDQPDQAYVGRSDD